MPTLPALRFVHLLAFGATYLTSVSSTAFASAASHAKAGWLDRWIAWMFGSTGTSGTTYSVPELDPSSAATALVLLVGSALVFHARRANKA